MKKKLLLRIAEVISLTKVSLNIPGNQSPTPKRLKSNARKPAGRTSLIFT
jgi:hypothetical protein